MKYRALVTDYDGTIATEGRVTPSTMEALTKWKSGGRKIILNTGRGLESVRRVFPSLSFFDVLVLENGGVLYLPETGEERMLCDSPKETFVDFLRAHKVQPLAVGKTVVATLKPNLAMVQTAIAKHGSTLQIIMNLDAVMVLPKGIDKASGMLAALRVFKIPVKEAVGVGDAENDLAFLKICGYSAAPSNALAAVKAAASVVLKKPCGAGVEELLNQNDLQV
jgi:HAD superfamily hydrolase (TIGR01484 family)